jgi:hypothetical protein
MLHYLTRSVCRAGGSVLTRLPDKSTTEAYQCLVGALTSQWLGLPSGRRYAGRPLLRRS